MTPLVSVIVPVYNAQGYLRDAVASVQAQTLNDWEIVLVDDGSTDNSADVIAQIIRDVPNVRAFAKDNGGPAAARNYGLTQAHGHYISFLDADDLYPPYKLEQQAARLNQESSLALVLGRIQYVWLPGGEIINIRFKEADNTLTHVHLGSGLFRREVFDRIGNFDETMRYSEDFDWFLRAHEANTNLLIMKAVMLYYRLHDSNMTRGKNMQEINAFLALKKSLDRRRQSGTIKPLPRWMDFDEAAVARRAVGGSDEQ